MPYDEVVDKRIREIVDQWPHTSAKKMFGGVCYLLNGNMVAGVHGDHLILRLGEAPAREALQEPHVVPFDLTGRPMKGWVMVAPEVFNQRESLQKWLDLARQFVCTLPAK